MALPLKSPSFCIFSETTLVVIEGFHCTIVWHKPLVCGLGGRFNFSPISDCDSLQGNQNHTETSWLLVSSGLLFICLVPWSHGSFTVHCVWFDKWGPAIMAASTSGCHFCVFGSKSCYFFNVRGIWCVVVDVGWKIDDFFMFWPFYLLVRSDKRRF